MRAERLRKGQVSTRGMRTGAKTATKDQEREYLERFERLAQDPSVLVPRWEGRGRDPFSTTRAQLENVRARQGSTFWLRWYGRGRRLRSAYAQTLLILKGGRIPSFASIRLRGRDVKYILRGNGLRDKLVAIHNADEPDARLLAFIDVARRKHLVIVSLPDDFFAVPEGGPLPSGAFERILAEADIEASVEGSHASCPHADRRATVEHELAALGVRIRLCGQCGKDFPQGLTTALEGFVLPPGGRFKDERHVRGSRFTVHPDSARATLDRLVEDASRAAREKSRRYDDVRDEDLLEWAEEALQANLDKRPEGFLIVGNDLWLGEFDRAAEQHGQSDVEREGLRLAFQLRPPRVRASEATLNRLLEGVWETDAEALLAKMSGGRLDPAGMKPLAAQRPSEALAALGRLVMAEERFAAFPRFRELAAPLRLAHDLFKAHFVGDSSGFQRRLAEGVRDEATKSLALALGRAFGQGASIEWHYAPHEKDKALFFEPAAREFAKATPETYSEALGRVAESLGVAPPTTETQSTEIPPSKA